MGHVKYCPAKSAYQGREELLEVLSINLDLHIPVENITGGNRSNMMIPNDNELMANMKHKGGGTVVVNGTW